MPSQHRTEISDELIAFVRETYGIVPDEPPVDLGGFHHLSARFGDHVVRVYATFNDAERVDGIQRARSALVSAGLPFAETVPALDGRTITNFDGRVVEVERFVPGENMNTWGRLLAGMPLLARIHETLANVDAGLGAEIAPHPNHIDVGNLVPETERGAAEVRRRATSDEEPRCADLAEELAHALEGREAVFDRQLVHGDFWDNNVLFDGSDVSIVLDLDFMGKRSRVDDVALTIYYAISTVVEDPNYFPDERFDGDKRALIHELANAYGALTPEERAALPLAIARTPLCFVAMAPLIDSDAHLKRHITRTLPDIEWALELATDG